LSAKRGKKKEKKRRKHLFPLLRGKKRARAPPQASPRPSKKRKKGKERRKGVEKEKQLNIPLEGTSDRAKGQGDIGSVACPLSGWGKRKGREKKVTPLFTFDSKRGKREKNNSLVVVFFHRLEVEERERKREGRPSSTST